MSKKRKSSSKQFYCSKGKDFSLVGAKRKLTAKEESELLAVLVSRWEVRRLEEYMDEVKQFMKMNGIKTPSEDDIKNLSIPTLWGQPLLTGGMRASKSWVNNLVLGDKFDRKIEPSKAWFDEVEFLKEGVYVDEAELRALPKHHYEWSAYSHWAIKNAICNPKVIVTNKA